jgi:superfamily II DNA/RNA helicase
LQEHADSKGGLLVIASSIPPSERDWVQWKGRTARSDRKGQYAVVLSEDQAPWGGDRPLAVGERSRLENALLNKDRGLAGSKSFREDLVDELLAHRNRDKKNEIEENSAKVLSGQLGNELCDHYYLKFRRSKEEGWPCPRWFENDKLLRKFLQKRSKENDYSITKANVEEFKQSVGLVYTSKY